jgi:hypothetical protein
MNGEHQSQQEQHQVAERVAHLETAMECQQRAQSDLREEVRTGFARVAASFARADDRVDARFDRVDARFDRVDARIDQVHEQILKIRTTDFRILLGISLSTAFGTMGLVAKVYGLL